MSNKLELKNQALLERISTLTAEYENKVADLRVELTITSRERDSLRTEVEEYRLSANEKEENDLSD